MKILVYGYGNPGRQDDGLGILFVDVIEKWANKKKIKNLYFDSNYQLNIEDAINISKFDIVIFVDASKNIKKSFSIKKINPQQIESITTHNITPENVLFLSKELYGKEPKTYLITIKGYRWEINKKLSKKAQKNLLLSLNYIKKRLLNIDWFSSKKTLNIKHLTKPFFFSNITKKEKARLLTLGRITARVNK